MIKTSSRFRNTFHFFVIFFLALFFLPKEGSPQSDGGAKGPPSVPVQTAVVDKKVVSNQIELVGTAEPVTESTVASEVSGVVELFPINEGDYVKKGQTLVRLEDQRLELSLKGKIAAREKIKINLAEAKKELDRMEKLKVAQSVAEKTYDEAFFRYEALGQELAKSEAEIDLLKYEISKKTVKAPFSGFVAKEHTQLGQWVNVGGSVVDLIDISRIEATVDVPERYSVNLRKGEKASILIASLSRQPREGVIETVIPQGDPNARTFPVKISLENPGMMIKSGMEVQVTFSVGGAQEALVAPKDAIVISGKDRLVYVVQNGVVTPETVVISGYFENFVSFEGNLRPGDVVVVRGNERLRPGQAVKVIQQ